MKRAASKGRSARVTRPSSRRRTARPTASERQEPLVEPVKTEEAQPESVIDTAAAETVVAQSGQASEPAPSEHTVPDGPVEAPAPGEATLARAATPSPVETTRAANTGADEALRTSGNRVEEFLGFRLGSEEYCIWIRSIKEIIRPPEITPIPRSPADIQGLISLRGTIVPVFDIRRRLGVPSGEVGPKSRIIVVVLDAGPVGMVVDDVTEVISVDPAALEPPPPTMGEREGTFVTATVRLRDRIVGVLHLERLVAIEVEAPLRAVA